MGEITYPIAEIFRSIQGEGCHTGRPAVFIRFAGCNLKCPWCDTDHTVKEHMTLPEIGIEVDKIIQPCDVVVLTGGEPTIIHQIIPVISYFGAGKTCIETNGVLWQRLRMIRMMHPDVWVTVSPKPQRTSYTSFQFANEIKVVYDGSIDMKKVDAKLPRHILNQHRCFIQPCSGNIQPALDYVLAHPWWRLSIQVQKVINVR